MELEGPRGIVRWLHFEHQGSNTQGHHVRLISPTEEVAAKETERKAKRVQHGDARDRVTRTHARKLKCPHTHTDTDTHALLHRGLLLTNLLT